MIINEKSVEKSKNLIKNAKRPIIVESNGDEYNRKMLEYGKFDFLEGIENSERKIKLRNIDSGFNKVLANIAKKNKVSLIFDLEKLRKGSKYERAKMLSQLIQNAKISSKIGVNIYIKNKKDKTGLLAFIQDINANARTTKSLDF